MLSLVGQDFEQVQYISLLENYELNLLLKVNQAPVKHEYLDN